MSSAARFLMVDLHDTAWLFMLDFFSIERSQTIVQMSCTSGVKDHHTKPRQQSNAALGCPNRVCLRRSNRVIASPQHQHTAYASSPSYSITEPPSLLSPSSPALELVSDSHDSLKDVRPRTLLSSPSVP